MNSQEVVDAADSQTLSEEGKFRLRVLTQLNAFVHCSDDVCLGQGGAPRCTVEVRQRLPSVTLPAVTVETLAIFSTPPILHSGGAASRSFTKLMTSVFGWVPLRSDFGVGDIDFPQVGRHLDRGDT